MRRCKFAAVMLVFAVMSGVSANEINDFSVNENGVFTVNGSVGISAELNSLYVFLISSSIPV